MGAAILLEYLESKGVVLTVVDGSLHLKAPTGVVTNEIKQSIAESKTALISLLCGPAKEHDQRVPQSPKTTLDEDELRYAYEERQAIMEHDGGLTSNEAREQARNNLFKQYKRDDGTTVDLETPEDFRQWVEVFALLAKWDAEEKQKNAQLDTLEPDKTGDR